MSRIKTVKYYNCEPVLGFNTKQWWVYDNENDIYIDPPSEVLDDVENYHDQYEVQEQRLADIIDQDPDWLQDEDYWVSEEIDI